MTVRRQNLSRSVQRRALRRRLPLQVEKLETRCMLMADEVVPVDVVEPVEDDLAYTTMAFECCTCPGIFPIDMAPELATETETEIAFETLEFLIDPIVESGEIDCSEFMFFSMGFEGAEPSPSEEVLSTDGEILITDEEVVVAEEPVDLVIENEVDPMIFASFSVTNDDGPLYEGPVPDPIPPFTEPLTDVAPLPSPSTLSETSGEESESEVATPSPEVPASKAFAAFGRTQNSFAASIASAFGSMGFSSDSNSDNGFIGGRRRGRR